MRYCVGKRRTVCSRVLCGERLRSLTTENTGEHGGLRSGGVSLSYFVSVTSLVVFLCGWTTCNAIFTLNSCEGSVPVPQVSSLSPATIPNNGEPALLTVNGSGFVPQSQIMWNEGALPTRFIDSSHLQTTITPQTFGTFGAGSTVQIWVNSPPSHAVMGCPNGGASIAFSLSIN